MEISAIHEISVLHFPLQKQLLFQHHSEYTWEAEIWVCQVIWVTDIIIWNHNLKFLIFRSPHHNNNPSFSPPTWHMKINLFTIHIFSDHINPYSSSLSYFRLFESSLDFACRYFWSALIEIKSKKLLIITSKPCVVVDSAHVL